MNKTFLMFLVILIEGYVVLATELIAIRTLIPFVGSGTEIISIIISAVLLPLAFGYHIGGNAFRKEYTKSKIRKKKTLSIRKILLRNVISSLIVLTIGLSYIFQELFFAVMEISGITNRLIQTSIYSILFLSFPVFLLGQTVPLVSSYFSSVRLSEITGKMLFFSTTGSFLGSVFSTIILMSYFGVHNTIIFVIFLLCVLVFLLVRKLFCYETFLCVIILSASYMLNSDNTMQKLDVVSNNTYNLVRIIDLPEKEQKIFNVNRSTSSQISKNPEEQFPYFLYIQNNFIKPIADKKDTPLDILIIGAGGFTIGLGDEHNSYTFIDIDPDLKEVAEKHFLNEELTPNKKFIASSARAFVHNNKDSYDLIIIDVFTNRISIPMECTTREFLLDVKKLIRKNGIIVANVIGSPTFSDSFSTRYHNTFASVFPIFSRQIMDTKSLWSQKTDREDGIKNTIYMYFNNEYSDDKTIYTDDKNTYSIDQP